MVVDLVVTDFNVTDARAAGIDTVGSGHSGEVDLVASKDNVIRGIQLEGITGHTTELNALNLNERRPGYGQLGLRCELMRYRF